MTGSSTGKLDDFDEEYEAPSTGSMIVPANSSDKIIERHFETGRLRVVQEKNDIFLSHVIDFIQGDNPDRVWGNLRPEYQRRLRWDNKKKSKLIESFIMNVPVPPVFLYEKCLGRFEVMDGQQRLNTISEFLSGSFALEGLDIWQALNGRTYSELPPLIRRGIERAKLSAITLMSDSSSVEEDNLDLRAQVFERLNTGGERLNAQELRNSLYSGSFNDLLVELSSLPAFTEAWDIPDHDENTRGDGTVSDKLRRNIIYKRMTDVEIVLRFFAFRETDKISGAVRVMLDSTMKRYRHCSEEERSRLKALFEGALSLCVAVFGTQVFRLPPAEIDKKPKLSRALYDAEMIAMSFQIDNVESVLANKERIRDAVLALAAPQSIDYPLMVGRANTASASKERILKVSKAVSDVIENDCT